MAALSLARYGDFDTEFTGARNLDELRQLVPELTDFPAWVRANAATWRSA